MLGRALIARLLAYPITHGKRAPPDGRARPSLRIDQSSFAAIARSSRDCFQIR